MLDETFFFFVLFNHNNDLKRLYQWVTNGFGYIHHYLVTNSLGFSQKGLLKNDTKCHWIKGLFVCLFLCKCDIANLSVLQSAWFLYWEVSDILALRGTETIHPKLLFHPEVLMSATMYLDPTSHTHTWWGGWKNVPIASCRNAWHNTYYTIIIHFLGLFVSLTWKWGLWWYAIICLIYPPFLMLHRVSDM